MRGGGAMIQQTTGGEKTHASGRCANQGATCVLLAQPRQQSSVLLNNGLWVAPQCGQKNQIVLPVVFQGFRDHEGHAAATGIQTGAGGDKAQVDVGLAALLACAC